MRKKKYIFSFSVFGARAREQNFSLHYHKHLTEMHAFAHVHNQHQQHGTHGTHGKHSRWAEFDSAIYFFFLFYVKFVVVLLRWMVLFFIQSAILLCFFSSAALAVQRWISDEAERLYTCLTNLFANISAIYGERERTRNEKKKTMKIKRSNKCW